MGQHNFNSIYGTKVAVKSPTLLQQIFEMVQIPYAQHSPKYARHDFNMD